MNYIGNAISLNMFEVGEGVQINVRRVEPTQVPRDATSALGYPETAQAASIALGWQVPANRISIKLNEGDTLYVFQYSGERLARGQTGIAADAEWRWYEVSYSKLI